MSAALSWKTNGDLVKPEMAKLIPAATIGKASISHFSVGEDEARLATMMSVFGGDPQGSLRAGTYAKLTVGGVLMMSDTQMEWRTNLTAVRRATGDVLVAGLGLGMILVPICEKREVRAVTVLEKSRDVVDLVLPHLRRQVRGAEKVEVIVADAMTWRPPPRRLWDSIYFDIWSDICSDNVEQITSLKRRFARRLRRGTGEEWMAAWREHDMRRGR